MAEPPVSVSSVRSKFETKTSSSPVSADNPTTNVEKTKVVPAPRLKKPHPPKKYGAKDNGNGNGVSKGCSKKPLTKPCSDFSEKSPKTDSDSKVENGSESADEVSGPKRATLAREIESLPKNSVVNKMRMFEGSDSPSGGEAKKVERTPPPVAAKPSFPKPSAMKHDVEHSESSESVVIKKTVSEKKSDASVDAEVKDKVDVRQKPTKPCPPRPPPSYRKTSLTESSDCEGSEAPASPRQKLRAKSSSGPVQESSQKNPACSGTDKPDLALDDKRVDKQPVRPPRPVAKKPGNVNDQPFSSTLVSKTSTQIAFHDNSEKPTESNVTSLTSKFNQDHSQLAQKPVPKPRPESVVKTTGRSSESGVFEEVEIRRKNPPIEKPKVADDVNATNAQSGTKSSSIARSILPPDKPPPPKPPRTFAHDIYLKARHRRNVISDPERSANVVDEEQLGDYEVVGSPKVSDRRRQIQSQWSGDSITSNASSHKYETIKFSGDGELLRHVEWMDNSQYGSDRSSSSLTSSYGGYSSVRSLQKSASDEAIYAKPSNLVLTDPLPPLYAVPNKKPQVPPKIRLDDGGYAVPSIDGRGRQSSLRRSQSFREQLSEGINKLEDHITKNFDAPVPGRRPVSYRREGKPSGVKTAAYNELRGKVDEIYSLLNYHDLDPANNPGSSTDHDSDDSDSQVDLSEIRRRIQHVAAIREKNRSVYERIRLFKDKLYPSLFQYALIIGLRQDDGTCVPDIRFSFPQFVSIDEIPIPDFCFPDKDVWMPVAHYDSETFSFVLTRQDGSRDYGYCRRVLPGHESGPRLPVVVCIVSPLGAHQLYTQVLDEVERRLHVSMDHAEELIQAVYAKPLPNPGRQIQIKAINNKGIGEILTFTRASDMRLENVNLDSLFTCLSIENVLRVFSSILLERRIILAANKLSTLTNSIHALASLLYPLQWEHTFIPLLPQSLLEMTCSPTPYIVGVLAVHLKLIEDLPTEEVLIVHLDSDQLHSPFNDEDSIVPKKLQKVLTAVVRMALDETDNASHRHLLLSEAFLRLFVEAIGHYGDHIVTSPGGQRQFNKEAFCMGVSSRSLRLMLEWLTETHLFQLFIMEQLESDTTTLSLFDTRIMEHRENLANMPVNAWANFRQWAKKMGKAIKTNIKGQGETKKK